MKILRTNSKNPDFLQMVRVLDAYLAEKDGDEADFFAQYNKVDSIKHVVVAYEDNTPLGCGAIKAYDENTAEVKRMFVYPDQREKGVAMRILGELENWAAELGYKKCILETGVLQHEAIRLYQKCGYQQIPNYGQYAQTDLSKCFEKNLLA